MCTLYKRQNNYLDNVQTWAIYHLRKKKMVGMDENFQSKCNGTVSGVTDNM